MSGDGRVVWAVTGRGALVRIDLNSGLITEAIGRTPSIRTIRLVRGSIGSLDGLGLAENVAEASIPLPDRLGGFAAKLDSLSLPVFRVSPTAADVQIPWELAGLRVNLSFETDAVSGWNNPPSTFQVVDAAPTFFLAGPYPAVTAFSYPFVPAVAAHGDWSGQVTEGSPAGPGEVVHLYGSGFGPVNAQPRTAEATPAEPLPELRDSLGCWIRTPETVLRTMPVLYAGLAPGLVGTYQISLQIPGDIEAAGLFVPGFLGIHCELESPSQGSAFALLPIRLGP